MHTTSHITRLHALRGNTQISGGCRESHGSRDSCLYIIAQGDAAATISHNAIRAWKENSDSEGNVRAEASSRRTLYVNATRRWTRGKLPQRSETHRVQIQSVIRLSLGVAMSSSVLNVDLDTLTGLSLGEK